MKPFVKNFIIAGVALIAPGIVGGILDSLLKTSFLAALLGLAGLVVAIIFVVKGIKGIKAEKNKGGKAGRERGGKGGRGGRDGGRREEPRRSSHEEESDDDIVTLLDKDGNEVDMVQIAGINYRGKFYAILQPVELLEGMDDDEALVFKVTRDRNGDDQFEIELNDDIIDAVFEEYNRLLDEEMNK